MRQQLLFKQRLFNFSLPKLLEGYEKASAGMLSFDSLVSFTD
jgi:hypothetical protein